MLSTRELSSAINGGPHSSELFIHGGLQRLQTSQILMLGVLLMFYSMRLYKGHFYERGVLFLFSNINQFIKYKK